MKDFLWSHAACRSTAIDGDIDVTLERLSAGSVRIRYGLKGRIDEIVIPPRAAPLRANNLWKTTCFEIFLAAAESQAYRELNFSPSSQWAAYDFDGYRSGMVQASLPAPPEIRVKRTPDRLDITVTLAVDLPAEGYDVGLAAVIEDHGGRLSYWALSHPGEAPDFHRRDCFVLELPPPGQP